MVIVCSPVSFCGRRRAQDSDCAMNEKTVGKLPIGVIIVHGDTRGFELQCRDLAGTILDKIDKIINHERE